MPYRNIAKRTVKQIIFYISTTKNGMTYRHAVKNNPMLSYRYPSPQRSAKIRNAEFRTGSAYDGLFFKVGATQRGRPKKDPAWSPEIR